MKFGNNTIVGQGLAPAETIVGANCVRPVLIILIGASHERSVKDATPYEILLQRFVGNGALDVPKRANTVRPYDSFYYSPTIFDRIICNVLQINSAMV
jgi:hypothetical protein